MWQEFVFTKDIVMEDEEEDSKAGITKEENRESIAAEIQAAEGVFLSSAKQDARLEMAGKVVDSVAAHYDKVREGVREIMSGTVLEYKAKAILLEGYQKGESVGYSKGETVGESKGESKGEIKKARRTADNLFRMNMPVEQIAEAVEVDISQVQEWLSKQKV